MKSFLTIILLSTFLFSKNLVIEPKSQNWSTASTAVGKFEVSKPFINIVLDKLTIRRNSILKNGKKIESGIISNIRIGIAKLTNNGQWKVERWGMSKKINKLLKPSETIEIKNFQTTIPIDGIQNLSNYWFVLQTTINNKGTTYSHSKVGLFKKVFSKKYNKFHNKQKPEIQENFWKPIANKIMKQWNKTATTHNGFLSTVKIIIDNKGNFTYKNLKLSGNSIFDKKLTKMLKQFTKEKWTPYKRGKLIEANFEFKGRR